MKLMINLLKETAISCWFAIFGARGELRTLYGNCAEVMPAELSQDTCEKLIARMEDVMAENRGRVWTDPVGSDTRVLGFEQDIPELIEKFEIERRIKAIDGYLGFKTRSWCLMANRLIPVDGNLGSGGGFHRDSPFSHQVKYIWYLTNVDKTTGPFEYLPGSHKNIIRTRNYYPLGEMRFEKVEGDLVPVYGKSGTLLICDTKAIHRGKPIERGVRYAITLYTYQKQNGVATLFAKSGLNPKLAIQKAL